MLKDMLEVVLFCVCVDSGCAVLVCSLFLLFLVLLLLFYLMVFLGFLCFKQFGVFVVAALGGHQPRSSIGPFGPCEYWLTLEDVVLNNWSTLKGWSTSN